MSLDDLIIKVSRFVLYQKDFMDKRFANMFNLSEEQAIQVLDTPQDQIGEEDSRYIAASHLINYPSEQSIDALIRAVQNTDPQLDNRIVRRKSIETLGRLQATKAMDVIRDCLADDDCYTVENAVWSIGEIGTTDQQILAEITQLLQKPQQSYRVIIHTLTRLDYQPALAEIREFTNSEDGPIASAAIAAVGRFSQDYSQIEKLLAFLQHPQVLARRLCIQDLIDAKYYAAIPHIAYCPVSIVFRLRGVKMLADAGFAENALTFADVQPFLEQVLRDHPSDLKLVHSYGQLPTLATLIQDLYDVDFGRSYLAIQLMLNNYAAEAPAALLDTYAAEAHNDYGAHFHVVKLFGWLKYQPAYDLIVEALHNTQPQFQKSRAAAAIALGELGDPRAIPELQTSLQGRLWDLKYAAMMTLQKLGENNIELVADEPDWLLKAKAASLKNN
jgi:bilin biosynthesis protein